MISKVSEQTMHYIRWVLAIAWLILIFSLFYDPISHHLSDPNNLLSPFKDPIISLANDPARCVRVQGECLPQVPYPMGTRIFWGMIIPSAIAIVFVFGHETWRRICPLYFLSQIPRALGLQPRLNIQKNSWLRQNHLYLQFALLFIGLNCRILFINSARPVFGFFLIFIILSAITMVFLYGGRSWCHYVCPFGVVQMILTGPRGLLDSQAHTSPPLSITQSMCRTRDSLTGQEKSVCINCKSPCLDIDAEKAYWENLFKPGRRLVQYGYLGLVSGYFIYYYLYAGNFYYYFSGAWTHEENQLETLFKPGFYIFEHFINIPKLVAVPLTLGFFVGMSCLICTRCEKALLSYLRRRNPSINRQQVLHRIFSLCTFIAFNAFFVYGGRPEILRLPLGVQLMFNALIVLVSTLWLYRTWGRSAEQYTKESLAYKMRRQLKNLSLDFSRFLEGRSLDELNPDELYVLAKVLPGATRKDRLKVYRGVLHEALLERRFEPHRSKEALRQLRERLQIKESEHEIILAQVIQKNPNLLNSVRSSSSDRISKTIVRGGRKDSSHQKAIASTQNRLWSIGEITVRCIKAIAETDDVKTFCLVAEPPVQFDYKPGQFVTLDLEIEGKRVIRSYSLSSTPSRPHTLEITVKRVPSPTDNPKVPRGLVSNWLHDNISVGSRIKLKGPMGQFTCVDNPSQKLLFISAGSGITPTISMLRWLCDTGADVDLIFVHSARSPRDIIFRHELEAIATRHPNFKLAITITRPESGRAWLGYFGRLNKSMLEAIAPDVQERSVYVCGPAPFLEAVKTMLKTLRFPMDNYYEESFGRPKQKPSVEIEKGRRQEVDGNNCRKIPTPSNCEPLKRSLAGVSIFKSESQQFVKHYVPCPRTSLFLPAEDREKITSIHTSDDASSIVVLAKSGKEIVCNREDFILEVIEQEGIELPSGCRMGVCKTCKLRLLQGEVNYDNNPECEPGHILPCIAKPVGRIVIEA